MHIMCENFIQGYIDEECKGFVSIRTDVRDNHRYGIKDTMKKQFWIHTSKDPVRSKVTASEDMALMPSFKELALALLVAFRVLLASENMSMLPWFQ